MLHDRFYGNWEQPTSIFENRKNFVCTVRVRVEPDGKVSEVSIVQGSGNPVMDESVLAAARKVGHIDAPPAKLRKDGAFEININFELE